MSVRIARAAMVVMLCALGATSVSAQDVVWNVSTDRQAYWIGEQVTLHLEACNTGDVTVTLDINAAPSVIDADGEMVWAPTLLPWVIWVDSPPGECRSAADQVWDQRNIMTPPPCQQVPPGWYRGDYLSSGGQQYFSQPFLIQDRQGVPVSRPAAVLLALLVAISGWICLRWMGMP
jgi:hypothetical protein